MHRLAVIPIVVLVAVLVAACGGDAVSAKDLELRDDDKCPIDEGIRAGYDETDLPDDLDFDDASDEPDSSYDLDDAVERGDGAYVSCTYLYFDNDEDLTVYAVLLDGADDDALEPMLEERAVAPSENFEFGNQPPDPKDPEEILEELADADPGKAVNVGGTPVSLARLDAGDDRTAVVLVRMYADSDERAAIVEGVAEQLA